MAELKWCGNFVGRGVRRGRGGCGAEALERRVLLSGTVSAAAQPTYYASTLSNLNVNGPGSGVSAGLTIDSGGDLFGTTSSGGPWGYGSIFEIPHGSSTPVTLAWFDGTIKGVSGPLLLDDDGNLYGTATGGNANPNGAVFELARGSSTVTTVAVFTGAISDTIGGTPVGGLVSDADGDMYGVTSGGGANGYGTVFEIARGTTTVTVLAALNSTTGSGDGSGLVIDPGGNLWGCGSLGVFELPNGGGAPIVVVSCGTNSATGTSPSALVADGLGNMYCATQSGGANNYGTVFEFNMSSGAILGLAPFFEGWSANSQIVLDGSGNLWGTTARGGVESGAFDGTLYEWVHGTSSVTRVWMFLSYYNVGWESACGLVADGHGNLFGATSGGGVNGGGTVYSISESGGAPQTPQVLFGFDVNAGWYPAGGLTMDASGNLYGLTRFGGANNRGTVFEIPRGASAAKTLVSSDDYYGVPYGTPALDKNGNIYVVGGPGIGAASLIEIPAGSSQIVFLARFPNQSHVSGSPVVDGNGNVFVPGGAGLYELPAGATQVVSVGGFGSGTAVGSAPNGLVVDASGNVYGMTSSGGANGWGTIFEIQLGSGSAVALTPLDLNSMNAASPLAVDAVGDLYWAANSGFYELAHSSSAVTALGGGIVSGTRGAPIVDSSGNLYLFTLDRFIELPLGAATYVSLLSFAGTVATGGPIGGMVTDGNGNYFGTTFNNDRSYIGSVFEVSTVAKGNTITGGTGADTVNISQDGDHHNVRWSINGGQPFRVPIDDYAGMTINSGGGSDSIVLDYGNGKPLPQWMHLNGTFTVNGLQGANPLAGTTVEIGKSTVYFNYSGANPVAAIKSALVGGYNGGAWNGGAWNGSSANGVITSSAARGNLSHNTAIGWADSGDGTGVNTVSNSVEIRYTLLGDVNLDGAVNITDVNALVPHYNSSGAWTAGDFNYDGQVNITDVNALVPNYNTSLGSQVQAATANSSTTLASTSAATVNATTASAVSTPASAQSLTDGEVEEGWRLRKGKGKKKV